jgi:membrane protease YdiL (CAAX protease family)
MQKLKITNTNILIMTMVLLLTVVPQLVIGAIELIFKVDIIDLIKSSSGIAQEWLIVILLINQYVFILLPLLVFVIKNKIDIKNTFRLNPIPIKTLAYTIIIAFCAWLVGQYVTIIAYHIYSILFGEPTNDIGYLIPKNWAVGIFFIALTPAVIEELVFRGVVLKAYENRGTIKAIFFSAFLFSILHLDILRVPGPLIIGIVSGYLVIKTNSIIPGMVIHFLFNGISIAGFYALKQPIDTPDHFPGFSEYVVLTFMVMIVLAIMVSSILAVRRIHLGNQQHIKPIQPILKDIEAVFSHWPIVVTICIFVIINLLELYKR